MGGSRMKGGCGRRCRCCHRHRLGCELLAVTAAASVVIAATRYVVGAAVAGRELLWLLLLVMVLRRASSWSLTAARSASSTVAITVPAPSQMRTRISDIHFIVLKLSLKFDGFKFNGRYKF